MTLKIGWFSTGNGPGSLGLLNFILEEIRRQKIEVEIEFVFSNRVAGEGHGSDNFHDFVKSNNIPLITHSSRLFRSRFAGNSVERRIAYDRDVMNLIKDYNPTVCILAGYMLIVGPEMCHRYTLLNLHPALPEGPTGTWPEVIWSLIQSSAETTGAMIHIAAEILDRGPVISYFSIPIHGAKFDEEWEEIKGKTIIELQENPGEELQLFKRIRQEGYLREPHLVAETLKALSTGSIVIKGGSAQDCTTKPIPGVCLSHAIEKRLRELKNNPTSIQ